jgi:hypothetical protein
MYDMLKIAVEYRVAIDDVTANKSLKLRIYELDEEDWEVVLDLIRVLKVRLAFFTTFFGWLIVDLQGRNTVLLTG